jgi:hypothetical protein
VKIWGWRGEEWALVNRFACCWRDCLRSNALLNGRTGDNLRLVDVEDLKVFFFEVTDCVALFVANHDWTNTLLTVVSIL